MIAAYTKCYQWVRDAAELYARHAHMLIEQLEAPDMQGLHQVVDAEATFLIFINLNPAISHFHSKALAKKGVTETDATRADISLYPIPRNTDPVTKLPLVPYTVGEKKEGEEEPLRTFYNRRTSHAVADFIFKKTGVYFNEGIGFGPDGDGWVRMNVGTTQHNVEETLRRIRKLILDLIAEYP